MPEISRFYGIVIKMFFDDHNPPHFHALYGEYEVLININSFPVFDGTREAFRKSEYILAMKIPISIQRFYFSSDENFKVCQKGGFYPTPLVRSYQFASIAGYFVPIRFINYDLTNH